MFFYLQCIQIKNSAPLSPNGRIELAEQKYALHIQKEISALTDKDFQLKQLSVREENVRICA